MAAIWATTIGASMISVVLQPMVDKAATMVVDRCDAVAQIKREISKLQSTLHLIEGILEVAEEKQLDDGNIQKWLSDLVDIAYETRDVVDDFVTSSIRSRRTSKLVKFSSLSFFSFLRCFDAGGSSSSPVVLPLTLRSRFRLANNIKCVRERFDEKKKESETFTILRSVVGGGFKSVSTRRCRRQETGPFINKQRNLFVGREDENEKIMEKILHHDDNRVHLISIWGMGGVGKTTLARFIYNDDRVKEEMYPSKNRRWFCVGEKNFNAVELIMKIIDEFKTQSVEEIQKKLVEKLKGGKFLIVLDDVWKIDSNEWKLLWDPLTNVGKGGVIIITTRSRKIITATNTPVPKDLKPLSYENCWLIFETHAFANGNSDTTPELKRVGREIVHKLMGLPLAAEVVGRSLLNEPDVKTWRSFLEAREWKQRNNDDDIMPALRWSYNHLPSHLKQCFAYCSLFPKNHVFDEKVLVEMWMAHDLIQNVGGGEQKRLEDVGAQYFKELVYASLFQKNYDEYVMHDMIHDLSLHVSNEEFASINGSLSTDQMKKVRHITIIVNDDYSKNLNLCKSKRILTLYVPLNWRYATNTKYLHTNVLLEVFIRSKNIRVLVLSLKEITEIPVCINELKHLRYLDISQTMVKSLPDSLCDLYNLQTLAAPVDAILPKEIVNMTNLRHLRANLTTYSGIAKLTSLQELYAISVCKDGNIGELGELCQLHGNLVVKGLENVTCSQDAAQANMQDKTHIEQLTLEFSNDLQKPNIATEVLEALQCPLNITHLKIFGYNGDKSPSWMTKGLLIANLQTLKITHLQIHCCGVELLQLDALVSLKCLKIEQCPNLTCIASSVHFATTVENLSVAFCGRLERIEFERLPSLRRLIISGCNNLISIPCLVEIKHLSLDRCAKLRSLKLQEVNSLECLKIAQCPVLELIFEEGSNSSPCSSLPLSSLLSVATDNKQILTMLLQYDLSYLQMLWIEVLTQVEQFSETEENNLYKLTSLEDLIIRDCKDLKSLPSDFQKLSSLKILRIIRCPKLQSLPSGGLPLSLEWLTISGCPLLYEQCKDESNLDFHMINHIHERHIHEGLHTFADDGSSSNYDSTLCSSYCTIRRWA